MNAVAEQTRRQVDVIDNASSGAMTPMDMIQTALMNGAGMDVMERLFSLQERWEQSQGRKAFDEAMAAAKAEIPVILKNRTVDFTSSKGRTHYRHEDLAEIARTVNPILSKHGLSYRFRTDSRPNEPVTVTCIISHRMGCSEENTLTGPRDESGNKNSLQQVGSTLTYLQRMTLKAALGLAAAEDDDGNKADDQQVETITEDQVIELREAIQSVDGDEKKLCQGLRIERLSDIPAERFERVKQIIAAKGQAK